MIPGEVFTEPGDIEINVGRATVRVKVANTGDRPIQVGSHYHFYETNTALKFDREKARGFRLNIRRGHSGSFRARSGARNRAVAYAGDRIVYGFNAKISGNLMERLVVNDAVSQRWSMTRIDRTAYAEMYGPTTGDRVRLGDTELIIEVERDHTIYGEEVKFGGGKVIRDGMGQSQRGAATVVDTIITNALIVDHWGIVKADIGLKEGRIVGIGKGGNPDVQPGVISLSARARK